MKIANFYFDTDKLGDPDVSAFLYGSLELRRILSCSTKGKE